MASNAADLIASSDGIVWVLAISIMISFGPSHIGDEIIYRDSSSVNSCLQASAKGMGGMSAPC
jgi:hypothetical protein